MKGEGSWVEFDEVFHSLNFAFVYFNPKIFEFHESIK